MTNLYREYTASQATAGCFQRLSMVIFKKKEKEKKLCLFLSFYLYILPYALADIFGRYQLLCLLSFYGINVLNDYMRFFTGLYCEGPYCESLI